MSTALEGRSQYKATGYQMIKSAQISRFRGFSSERVDDCRRINVLVGKNGSGKTAFLEALFFAISPNPDISNRLRQWRGYGPSFSGPPSEIEDALWRDLFHLLDTNTPIQVSLEGSSHHTRSLSVSYGSTGSLQLDGGSPPSAEGGRGVQEAITFEWAGPHGPILGRATPKLGPTGIEFIWEQQPPPVEIETYFFAANHTYSSTETAQRFSILSRANKIEDILALFTRIFPELGPLTIEVYAGTPMVSAPLPGTNEKRAINILSGGINKLASILFAIASTPGCVVLIDEIEAGFHHTIHSRIWQSLLYYCDNYDAQVFVTTHSEECLQAAAEVAQSNSEKFSLIKAKENTLTQVHGDMFVEAVNEGVEVR